MRRLRLERLAVVGAAGALSAAALFGFVGRGDAAGTNICPPNAFCLSAVVSPHVTSATPPAGAFAAFAAGRFNNNATSTATHLNLTLFFNDITSTTTNPPAATVQIDTATIGTFVDGAAVAATCTPAKTGTSNLVNVTSVSCAFANLAGGHYAKLQLPFTPVTPNASASKIQARLVVTYGEGNGGSNDTQTKSDFLTIGDGATGTGKCTSGGSQLPSVTNSSGTASIGVTDYPAASSDQHLPCTAVGIQALDDPTLGRIVSLELPLVPSGSFATIVHDVTPLPPKTTLKSLVIQESLESTGTNNFTLKLPACDSAGLPPSPAAAGFSSDTCVFDRIALSKGGGRFILHGTGNTVDPRYTP